MWWLSRYIPGYSYMTPSELFIAANEMIDELLDGCWLPEALSVAKAVNKILEQNNYPGRV